MAYQSFVSTICAVQCTLANSNRGVSDSNNFVLITEFVQISEVTLILYRINDIKICDNPMLLVLLFNPILNALNL